METGLNFKTHARYWPRNELVLAWPQVNELASEDYLNAAWPELWKYRRPTGSYPQRQLVGYRLGLVINRHITH